MVNNGRAFGVRCMRSNPFRHQRAIPKSSLSHRHQQNNNTVDDTFRGWGGRGRISTSHQMVWELYVFFSKMIGAHLQAKTFNILIHGFNFCHITDVCNTGPTWGWGLPWSLKELFWLWPSFSWFPPPVYPATLRG